MMTLASELLMNASEVITMLASVLLALSLSWCLLQLFVRALSGSGNPTPKYSTAQAPVSIRRP